MNALPKLIPIALDLHPDGEIFILAAPSKEAFISSFESHFESLAAQLCAGSLTTKDNFTRFRQAAFIGSVYSELKP